MRCEALMQQRTSPLASASRPQPAAATSEVSEAALRRMAREAQDAQGSLCTLAAVQNKLQVSRQRIAVLKKNLPAARLLLSRLRSQLKPHG